jgi:hypothetical protein
MDLKKYHAELREMQIEARPLFPRKLSIRINGKSYDFHGTLAMGHRNGGNLSLFIDEQESVFVMEGNELRPIYANEKIILEESKKTYSYDDPLDPFSAARVGEAMKSFGKAGYSIPSDWVRPKESHHPVSGIMSPILDAIKYMGQIVRGPLPKDFRQEHYKRENFQ